MVNVSIPLKSSSWAWWSSFPAYLNSLLSSIYPNPKHTWLSYCRGSQILWSWWSDPITKGITDFPIVETVGATDINSRDQNIIDALQVWNYYNDSNVWIRGYFGWAPSIPTWVTMDFDLTTRLACLWELNAWLNVWATIKHKVTPMAMQISPFGWPTATMNVSSITATYKIMDTSWALTTIWSVTKTDWRSMTYTMAGSWQQYIVDIIDLSWTFTPVTTAAWDRLVVEYNIVWDISHSDVSNVDIWFALSLWTAWSINQIRNLDSYRPIQISVS